MNIQTARRGRYMQKTAGGTKSRRSAPSAPSKSFKEKKKAEYKQKKAEENLNTYINNNQNLKNQSTLGSILSTVSDSPQKFGKNKESRKEFVERQIKENGRINAAAQAVLDFYNDGRNDYQRGLNTLRTSSPEAAQAYAKKFPVEDFAMKIGPVIAGAATGIPFGVMDYLTKTKDKAAKGINTLSERGDVFGALARTGQDIINSFTPEQAKNISINIQDNQPIDKLLRDQNIINASTDVDPILRAANAQIGSEDIMDIFDPEKAAMDASLPTGDIVYSPVNEDKQSKVDFINQVEGTNFTVENAEQRFNIDEQFERSKQKQGMIIRDEVEIEEPEENIAGQFNFTPYQDTINITGADDDQSIAGSELASANQNPEFMGLNPGMIMNPYEQSQLGEGTAKTFPPTNFATLDPNVNPEVPFSEYTDPFLMPPQSSMQSIPMNADGGSIDNYGNMSTHEKLMRMAAEMYG